MTRFLNQALAEIAARRGLHHEERSGGWIVRVGDGHRHLETYGYVLSLNRSVPDAVARDKAAAAERLVLDGVPTVPTGLVLVDRRQGWIDGRRARDGFDDAVARSTGPFVVKPNGGSSGTDVVRVDDIDAAWAATRALLATEPSVVVQPVVDITSEERWVLLGDEPVIRYTKSPAAASSPTGLPMFNLALGATVASWGVDERRRRALVDLITDVEGRTVVMEVNSGWSFEHLVRVRPATRPAAVAAYEAALDVALGLRDLP